MISYVLLKSENSVPQKSINLDKFLHEFQYFGPKLAQAALKSFQIKFNSLIFGFQKVTDYVKSGHTVH